MDKTAHTHTLFNAVWFAQRGLAWSCFTCQDSAHAFEWTSCAREELGQSRHDWPALTHRGSGTNKRGSWPCLTEQALHLSVHSDQM